MRVCVQDKTTGVEFCLPARSTQMMRVELNNAEHFFVEEGERRVISLKVFFSFISVLYILFYARL